MWSVKVTKAIIHVYNQLRKHFIFGLKVWHKGKLNKVATLYMRKRHSFAAVISTSNSAVCTHNTGDWPWWPASKKVRSIWTLQTSFQESEKYLKTSNQLPRKWEAFENFKPASKKVRSIWKFQTSFQESEKYLKISNQLPRKWEVFENFKKPCNLQMQPADT